MMKLGKKLMGAVLVAALTVTMSISAFAAPSPSNDGVASVGGAKDKNGNTVTVTMEALTGEGQKAVETVKTTEGLKKVLGNEFKAGMTVVDAREVVAPANAVFPLTITFKVPGVTAGSKVAVLHFVNGAWQVEKSTAANGTITATFDSLSPVAFVVDKTNAAAPQTGVAGVSMVAMAAAAAAVGTFAFKKEDK